MLDLFGNPLPDPPQKKPLPVKAPTTPPKPFHAKVDPLPSEANRTPQTASEWPSLERTLAEMDVRWRNGRQPTQEQLQHPMMKEAVRLFGTCPVSGETPEQEIDRVADGIVKEVLGA